MATMEIEAPPESPRPNVQQSRVFPLNMFCFCPSGVQHFIPGTFSKIQDETHLILVIGGIACLMMIVNVAAIFHSSWDGIAMVKCIGAFFFVFPVFRYLIQTINQYDDRLQSKQQDCKRKKENLTKSYNELLADMDGLLQKSAESSAGLAERSFESKRRDFQRFLERAKSRYGSTYGGPKADADHLLKQFRRFCVNWLSVFEECSIDPIRCPKRVVTSEELNRCTSIVEVCDLCLDRLRVTEVRFISVQRDQDAQILRNNRKEIRRITSGEAIKNNAVDSSGGLESGPSHARQVRQNLLKATNLHNRISWIEFGGFYGCRYSPDAEGHYPAEICFVLGRLVLLSREHAVLLFSFLFGWVVCVIDKFYSDPKTPILYYIVVVQLAVVVMLVRFEELDVIQQLEREVKQLAQSTAHVEQQREKMREFWSNAQQLTELWLYRTVPRLDLYKELHSQLEDAPSEDLLSNISGANAALEELDRRLGELDAWRNNGTLTIETKKSFGKTVNQLCQVQEFDEILVKLEDISNNDMKALTSFSIPKAAQPAQPAEP